tara:strand:- start:4560 stop:6719 length:2160 start_codon:yes stop_codon:yes gene_type:complete
MASTWKKVVTENSNASVTTLNIPSSNVKISSLPTTGEQGDKVVLHIHNPGNAADGAIRVIDQNLLGAINTTYDVDETTGIFDGGTTTWTLIEEAISHGSIPHYSGSQPGETLSTTPDTTEVHIAWNGSVPYVINAANYTNTELTHGPGIGIDTYTQLTTTNRQGEISSSNIQAWTSVGDLGSDADTTGIGGGNIGANSVFPASGFNIDVPTKDVSVIGNNWNKLRTGHIALGADGSTDTNLHVLGGNSSYAGWYGQSNANFSASSITAGSALNNGGTHQFGTLGIEGEFIYSLGFYEMAFSQMTSSVIMGNELTNSHSFNGDFTASAGFTSSGFTGDGENITGINLTSVTYSNLTLGNGFSQSAGTAPTFAFQSDFTTNLLLDGAGITSGLTFTSDGLEVAEGAITNAMLITGSIGLAGGYGGSPMLAGGSITQSAFTASMMSRVPYHISSSFDDADSLLYDTNGASAASNQKLSTTLGALKSRIIADLPDYSATTGTVTSITIFPQAYNASVDGLYLGITNASTEATISIEDLVGGAQVDGTHWTASADSNQFLSVENGGLGKGTKKDSAEVLLAGPFDLGALQFGNNTNDVITIAGNLTVTNTDDPTTSVFKSENLIISDSCFLLGAGSGNITTDFGITFGQDPTQSNTLMYDSGIDNKGRFGLSYGGPAFNDSNAVGATKTYLLGVYTGSESEANSDNFDVDGNILIKDEEIYFFV